MTGPTVESYLAAERALDAAAVAEHFSTDATLVAADGSAHEGRAAIRRFYETTYANLGQFDIEVVSSTTEDGRVALEWVASGPSREPMCGVSLIRLAESGFTELRVYTAKAAAEATWRRRPGALGRVRAP